MQVIDMPHTQSEASDEAKGRSSQLPSLAAELCGGGTYLCLQNTAAAFSVNEGINPNRGERHRQALVIEEATEEG